MCLVNNCCLIVECIYREVYRCNILRTNGLTQQILSVFTLFWGRVSLGVLSFVTTVCDVVKLWRSSHQNTNKFLTLVEVRGLCHMVRFSFLLSQRYAWGDVAPGDVSGF